MRYSQPHNRTMVLHVLEPADSGLRHPPVHVFSAPSWFDARAIATTAWPRGWNRRTAGTEPELVVLDPTSQVDVVWSTIEHEVIARHDGRDYVVHWIDPFEEVRRGSPAEYLKAKADEPYHLARARVRELEKELLRAKADLSRIVAGRRRGRSTSSGR